VSFAVLALIVLAGWPARFWLLGGRPLLPVVVGELLAGVVVGRSGVGWLHAAQPTVAVAV